VSTAQHQPNVVSITTDGGAGQSRPTLEEQEPSFVVTVADGAFASNASRCRRAGPGRTADPVTQKPRPASSSHHVPKRCGG
jgi:hypothetical protein